MDEILSKYDESLQALEEQRESLELVIQKMGAEWEESGAGIGWMGDIFLNSNATNTTTSRSTPPLLPMIQSSVNSNTESCHDYLQTLLNVNNELVTQSLTSPSANNHRLYNTHGDDPNNIASTVSKHPLLSPPLTETDVVNHGTTANLISQSILRTQRQDSLHQFCSPPEE